MRNKRKQEDVAGSPSQSEGAKAAHDEATINDLPLKLFEYDWIPQSLVPVSPKPDAEIGVKDLSLSCQVFDLTDSPLR